MSDTFDGYDPQPGAQSDSPTGTQQDPSSQTQPSPAGAETGESAGQPGNDGMIPRHRFQEVIEARRQWEQSARQIWEQNQQLQRELQELRGGRQQGQAQAPVDENAKRIREQLLEVVPELKQMLELAGRADELRSAAEMVPTVRQMEAQVYDNLGAQAVRTLDTAINATFKGIQLENEDRRAFHVAFIDYLDNVPQARQRYMSGDMSIATEWWANRQKRMFDPFRRQATVNPRESAQRVSRLPKAGPGTQTLGQGGPGKPKTEDELHEAAFDALMSRMNQG
jgi:hypothetical protein